MSVSPDRPPLRLVDPDTGEVHEAGCPECEKKAESLEIAHDKLDAAWREVRRLQNDPENVHEEHPERERVERLHAYWQEKTRHPRALLDMGKDSRFEAYLRGLRLAKKVAKNVGSDLDPEALMRRAIDGAGFDPWRQELRNGKVERYDDPTTIFKNLANFEKMVNRAPRAAA